MFGTLPPPNSSGKLGAMVHGANADGLPTSAGVSGNCSEDSGNESRVDVLLSPGNRAAPGPVSPPWCGFSRAGGQARINEPAPAPG
jgi:hypothetical protein